MSGVDVADNRPHVLGHTVRNATTQFWMRCEIFTPASYACDAGSAISQLAVLFRAIATI